MARMPDGWVVTVKADRREVRISGSRELVLCKNCKHAHMTYDGECKYCDFWQEDGGEALYLDGDFFCAAGERRDSVGWVLHDMCTIR